MTNCTSTSRRFGKSVAPAVGSLPCPTLPLPAVRDKWPTLNDEEIWRAILGLQIHLELVNARPTIARCGGSVVLLEPLHDAFARSRTKPVPLETALGGAVHPVRLAYLLLGMNPSPARRDAMLPPLKAMVVHLLASGHQCDIHIAAFLTFCALFRYRDDPVMRVALHDLDVHYARTAAQTYGPSMAALISGTGTGSSLDT